MQSVFHDILDNCCKGSILILGFGKEGKSTYRLLRKLYPDKKLSISDKNKSAYSDFTEIKHDTLMECISGDDYLECIANFDTVFKSPGISIREKSNLLEKTNLTSQTDVFLQAFRAQTIGITGTKGKSTTSSLIYHLLKKSFPNSILVGNIGVPPFDMLESINSETRIVFELSGHQLEGIRLGPSTLVFLNLFHEHLDFYGNFENYKNAKLFGVNKQLSGDKIIFNHDEGNVCEAIISAMPIAKLIPYSVKSELPQGYYTIENQVYYAENGEAACILPDISQRKIPGVHNLGNILASIAAVMQSGMQTTGIAEGIASFCGLPHRMELVGVVEGVYYYNDSIATIPESAMYAIETIPEARTLIAGGFDRGVDYSKFADFLASSSITNLIVMGKAGKRLAENLARTPHNINIFHANNMQEAVSYAKSHTKSNEACLLAPAASSYDMFKNFEERGEVYRKYVLAESTEA